MNTYAEARKLANSAMYAYADACLFDAQYPHSSAHRAGLVSMARAAAEDAIVLLVRCVTAEALANEGKEYQRATNAQQADEALQKLKAKSKEARELADAIAEAGE